jgi:hypothetical protein
MVQDLYQLTDEDFVDVDSEKARGSARRHVASLAPGVTEARRSRANFAPDLRVV